MPTPKIKVNDFVRASRAYVEKSLEKANKNDNAYLTKAEAKALPKDLRDNFAAVSAGGKSVRVAEFKESFTRYVAASARAADANKDGVLSSADGSKLPRNLQDNFKNYVVASRPLWGGGSGAGAVKDKSKASDLRAHLAEYGVSRVGFDDAFARGVKAVLKDRDYGPGGVLRDIGDGNGGELTDAQIAAELKKAFKSMALLPVGESSESGFDPRTQWIFSVDCDVGSDHGFWVGVDRETGATEVTNFN